MYISNIEVVIGTKWLKITLCCLEAGEIAIQSNGEEVIPNRYFYIVKEIREDEKTNTV